MSPSHRNGEGPGYQAGSSPDLNGLVVRNGTMVIPAEERIARERRLRRAVLIEAIRCLEGTSDTRERTQLRRQALNWLHGCHTASPFSFLNVCESLGLDPTSVRREVLARFLGPSPRSSGNQLADIVREQKRRGRVSVPRRSRNGYGNGQANGHVNGHANSHAGS